MNCERFREKLIDFVYEELDETEAQAVREHLETCPSCQEELHELQLACSALAHRRAGEPEIESLKVRVADATVLSDREKSASPRRLRLRIRGFLAASAGIAAAVLIVLSLWVLHEKTVPSVYAETGPVEIKRLGVSLTILSDPERRPRSVRAMYQQAATQQLRVRRRSSRFVWSGMALVRDQRIVRNLKRGTTQVRFTDVPSGILSDSVRLRSLDAPDALSILEQNYQYDLASVGAILRRYIDKPISVTFEEGEGAGGTLLSFDDKTLVIEPPGQGPRNISRQKIKAITFAKLPEGLLSRPTLLWKLQNDAASRQQFEVAYLTGGLRWRADYVLKLAPAVRDNPTRENRSRDREGAGKEAGKRAQASRERKPAPLGRAERDEFPDILDTADLVGYATITNNSGVTYEDAQLKLLAGDVNLILPELRELWIFTSDGSGLGGGGQEPFAEKAFFEYHLYTLGYPTTIHHAETKQIQLVSGSGIRLKRGYVYDPRANRTAARVVSELKNSEGNGLGKPLPKGVVRLYAPDPEGIQTYVAQTTIDHTPKDEMLRLPWGYAFDIACSFRETDYRHRGNDHHKTAEYSLRNHKDYDVTITVIARVPRSTYKGNCNYRWIVREVGIVEIRVPVKANSDAKVKFSYSYNPTSGGGLRSP